MPDINDIIRDGRIDQNALGKIRRRYDLGPIGSVSAIKAQLIRDQWNESYADFFANAIRDIPVLLAHIESQQAEIDRVKRERDGAVEDLKLHGGCPTCKHKDGISPCKRFSLDLKTTYARCAAYEWRGLRGEGEKA